MTAPFPPIWPVSSLVILDCDSTLTTVEGIDELARMGGQEHDVAAMTKHAMEGDIPLEVIYGNRLVTVNPTRSQVRKIAEIYRKTVVPHTKDVITALQSLGTDVFIVSGGLIEPVRDFGVWLGVPRDHIFAVNMEYDQLAGQWWRYWEQPTGQNPRASYLAYESAPLAGSRGKNQVITQIRQHHSGRAMLVGDGGSDLEAAIDVDLFVGFGGATYRKRVADSSPVYIHAQTLAPILPLALGQLGNTPRFARLWVEGLSRIYNGEVTFMEEGTRNAFFGALRRANGT